MSESVSQFTSHMLSTNLMFHQDSSRRDSGISWATRTPDSPVIATRKLWFVNGISKLHIIIVVLICVVGFLLLDNLTEMSAVIELF